MTEFLACNIHECLFLILASSNLTEEQHQIQELARDFAKNELAPNMMTWDEEVRSVQYWLLRAFIVFHCLKHIHLFWENSSDGVRLHDFVINMKNRK